MTTQAEILIIGGGLAGMAAARRANSLGLKTSVIANSTGSLPYTSGALDLIAVYPTETKFYHSKPWETLSDLLNQQPDHPYSKVGLKGVKDSIDDFMSYLEDSPLKYYRRENENIAIITGAGTIKPTYAVQGSLKANVLALEQRKPTLIAGFKGLTDFAPEQVVENLQDRWPGLVAQRLDLTGLVDQKRRITVANIASEFEKVAFRAEFAKLVKPMLGQAKFLGLPAILGMDKVMDIVADLENRLGVEVFEIPLLSPALPGTRLANMLKNDLLADGISYRQGVPVDRLEFEGDKVTVAHRQARRVDQAIPVSMMVMATGRFFGGGLVAEQHRIVEPLLNTELEVPASRDDWHMKTFLGAPGHPINRVGVKTDEYLRPVGADGKVLYKNISVAGAILDGHDWVREKSGAGISIATGYAAVDALLSSSEVEAE